MTKSPDLQSRLEKLTPSQRELLLQHLRQQSTQPSAIPRTDAEPVLSYAQQRLLFLDQLSNGGSTYNICGGVKIRGHVSVDLLDRSLSAILSRHDTLRTRFPEGCVVVEPPPAGSVLQIRQGNHEDLSAAIQREFQHVFSLSQGPLYRFVLLPLTPTEHLFLISLHHIVADGWSLGVLIREAGQIYAAFATNTASPLPPLSIQYVDFSAWQRKHLQGPALDKHIEFWKSELAGAPQIVNLPTDFPRGATQSFDGATYTAIFPSALAARIASLSASRGATPFMTLFAAFSVFLARYSGQRDLLVGSPVANRTLTETESLIGLFVNTLVLRTNLSDNPTFDQCLQRVQETVRRAFAHQELPFDLLVDALRPDRNLSLSPLVQVMFAFQNAHAVAGYWRCVSAQLCLICIPLYARLHGRAKGCNTRSRNASRHRHGRHEPARISGYRSQPDNNPESARCVYRKRNQHGTWFLQVASLEGCRHSQRHRRDIRPCDRFGRGDP